jgi:hypothetical protein
MAESLQERKLVRRIDSESEMNPKATARGVAWELERAMLTRLRARFEALASSPNRQAAGLALQDVLNGLFSRGSMHARAPFRIDGEQIDGSFVLDERIYHARPVCVGAWVYGEHHRRV